LILFMDAPAGFSCPGGAFDIQPFTLFG